MAIKNRQRIGWLKRSRPEFFATLCIQVCSSLLLCSDGQATTYHLDAVNGNDANPGTSETQPWKTLVKAQTTVVSGDTVIVRNGSYGTWGPGNVYGEGSWPYESYTRTDWVTYQAAPGHHPVLAGISINYQGASHNTYLTFDGFTIGPTTELSTIDIRNAAHVKLLNLNIIGAGCNTTRFGVRGWGNYGCTDITIDRCTFSGGSKTGRFDGFWSAIIVDECNVVVISNNEIRQFARYGIVCSCNNTTISNNNIHQIGGDGIFVGGGKGPLLIKNNQVHDLYIYTPSLTEAPTATTWSSDGKTMTNPSATWGVGAPYGWTGLVELRINSGTNAKTGDNDVTVATITPTQITLDKSIKIDPGGATPSNVNYYFIDVTHGDLLQVGYGRADNVTIRKNRFYDSYGQLCEITPAPGSTNYVFENNLCWRTYTNGTDEYSGTVRLHSISGLTCRNNTIIGNLSFCDNSGVTTVGNIVGYVQRTNTTFIKEDYNIFNRGGIGSSAANDIFLNSGHSWDNWNDPRFTGIFFDYSNGNFGLASASSLGVGHGDPTCHPLTDILGKPRDSQPDAGCYEYVPPDPNNHAPVLEAIGNRSLAEGSVLSFTVSGTDADGDSLVYSAQIRPSGSTFTGQTFSWTPNIGQAGIHQVRFVVSDSKGGQDSELVTITVIPLPGVNHAPVLDSIGAKSVVKGTQLGVSVNAADADGDTITYSASGLPTGATFVGHSFTWTPGLDQVGTYQVTFTASDGKAQDSETITITVKNINRAPVLAGIGSKSVRAGSSLSFSVGATDADGDSLVYSANGLPSGASFMGNAFSWTPSDGQVGSYSVTISVSDGLLEDSETFSITVSASDKTPPKVSGASPKADAIQAPLNTLLMLHVTDSGDEVDANSVVIQVNGQTAYSGNVADYTGALGHCRRTGTQADYRYILQREAIFGFDQQVQVSVSASDLAGNAMDPCSYSFGTEMRSFGKNWKASSNPANYDKAHAICAMDSKGNVWIAWHAGPEGSRDVYVARLDAQTRQFGDAVQLTANSADQCNPSLAISENDQVYAVWQDYSRGNWDICGSRTLDGSTWSGEARVTDSNDQEVHPVIAVDRQSPHRAYVAWQDHRAGNDDIYVAYTDNGFVSQTFWQVTSQGADQTDPTMAIAADNTAYLVWTDRRNGSADLYGSSSANGFQTTVPVINASGNQTDPAMSVEPTGSVLHLVWSDDRGGNTDIFYTATDGMPPSPLTGVTLIDDLTGATQASPSILASSAGVFACWTDSRRVGGSRDTDLYFADLGSGSSWTNVLVGDEQTNSNQSEPSLGVDLEGHPYVVWTDGRNPHTEIYLAGNTYIKPEPLKSSMITAHQGGTVGTPPTAVDGPDDVSVVVPAGACESDMTISISEIRNTPATSLEFLAAYDIGPSGAQFQEPVTVTIPYAVSNDNEVTPYWYDPLTDAMSQQGITDVSHAVITSTLHALTFKTTHFTQFYLVGTDSSGSSSGSGGGGGCSVAPAADGQVLEFLIPYIGLGLAMAVLRLLDDRRRRPINT